MRISCFELIKVCVLTCFCLSLSCSNKKLSGNPDNETSDTSSPASKQATATTADPIATADEPVMTGGGFLVCQTNPTSETDNVVTSIEIACAVQDEDAKVRRFDNADQVTFARMIAEGNPSNLVVNRSEDIDGGTYWFITINPVDSNIRIIAIFPSGQTLETELNMSPDPNSNPDLGLEPSDFTNDESFSLGPELINNRSFSNPPITNPQFSENGRSWSHLDPASVDGWQAEWNNNTCTNAVRIEVQRSLANNEQWIDLAGSCEFGETPPPGGSNLRLSQTITSIPGYSYQISFRYRLQNTERNAFEVVGPEGETLFSSRSLDSPTADTWQTASLRFTATADITEINLLEVGTDPLRGTLLDDVSVRELRPRQID